MSPHAVHRAGSRTRLRVSAADGMDGLSEMLAGERGGIGEGEYGAAKVRMNVLPVLGMVAAAEELDVRAARQDCGPESATVLVGIEDRRSRRSGFQDSVASHDHRNGGTAVTARRRNIRRFVNHWRHGSAVFTLSVTSPVSAASASVLTDRPRKARRKIAVCTRCSSFVIVTQPSAVSAGTGKTGRAVVDTPRRSWPQSPPTAPGDAEPAPRLHQPIFGPAPQRRWLARKP